MVDVWFRERVLEAQWKEKAPAISECLRRLRKEVQVRRYRLLPLLPPLHNNLIPFVSSLTFPPINQSIKTRINNEQEAAYRALASAQLHFPSPSSSATCYPWKSRSQTPATKLSAWELMELKQLIMDKDPGKTGMVSTEDLVWCVMDMEMRGRRLRSHGNRGGGGPVQEVLRPIITALNKGGKIPW